MRSGVTHLEERPYTDAFAQEDSDQEFLDAEEGARPAPWRLEQVTERSWALQGGTATQCWPEPF